jgi:hypothetical protein
MAIVRTLLLSLAAIAVPIFGFSMDIGEKDQGALCGGRPYKRMSVPNGASPFVELTAEGITGPFLLDYGATRSSLSAAAFPGPEGSIRTAEISLPGIERAEFHLARYDLMVQPGKGQLGVIGDDLLSRLTVELHESAAFLGADSCRPEALMARGMTAVAQNGFFSSDPSKIRTGFPNVPVVFLRLGEVRVWAQIDTGYEDSVHPARSTSTRLYSTVWSEAGSRSTGLTISTLGRARAASAGLCTGSRTARCRSKTNGGNESSTLRTFT